MQCEANSESFNSNHISQLLFEYWVYYLKGPFIVFILLDSFQEDISHVATC